jgi:hypothetical protein
MVQKLADITQCNADNYYTLLMCIKVSLYNKSFYSCKTFGFVKEKHSNAVVHSTNGYIALFFKNTFISRITVYADEKHCELNAPV